MKTLCKLNSKEKFFHNDFFVFDVETTLFKENEKVEFKFGIIYGYNFIKIIYSKNEFIEEFKKPLYKKKKIFAHNAEFDLNVIYDNIYLLDKKAIFNNRFICCTNNNCLFCDSYNIFNTSVKTLGKFIKHEKLNLSQDYIINDKITKNDIDYCVRDCEIVFESLLNIFEFVGNIKITLAGLALDLYRRRYQPFHIDYNECVLNFFLSYYGGRTEAFFIGEVNAVSYDINSLYAYCMITTDFPNPKFLKNLKSIDIDKFLILLKNYEGCAFIKLKHKKTKFGFLPFRKNGKLFFPGGIFEGYYNFNEIRFALENDVIELLKVENITYSKKMKSPFRDYVLDIFDKKNNSNDEFWIYTYKLFNNSLYGKFAQKVNSEFIYIDDMTTEKNYNLINDYKKNKKLKKISLFNENRNDCFLEVSNEKSNFFYHTIPLFSSYITSHARIYLLKNILKYEKFGVLYCDTDSIFFKNDPCIEVSKDLGKFKKENKIIKKINGLKNYDYSTNNIIFEKIKGIPKKNEKINNKYVFYSLVKTKESLRRKIDTNKYIKREKQVIKKYDKRIIKKDGNTEIIII